jgi:hypothetical protein
MHQAKKSQQWCFGMKFHSGLAHIAEVTLANVYDKHPLPQ